MPDPFPSRRCAGRDGRPAECVLLYGAEDLAFAEGPGLASELERRRYRRLLERVQRTCQVRCTQFPFPFRITVQTLG